MMRNQNFYFEINPVERKILSHPKEIQENWKNISGLPYLSEDELYDLSWAGYDNQGFLKISSDNKEKLKKFSCDDEIFNQNKIYFRNYVTELRYQKENDVVCIDDYFWIQLNDRCKLLILMKYLECIEDENLIFNWKTIKGTISFNSSKFIQLYKKIQIHIQQLFEEELRLHEQINNSKNFIELLNLNLIIK